MVRPATAVGPWTSNCVCWASMVPIPPATLPSTTPIRLGSTTVAAGSPTASPECSPEDFPTVTPAEASASSAATIANWA